MVERDAIIAEYKVCSDIVSRSFSVSWQSASLLLGFALTGAILVLIRAEQHDIGFATLATLIGAGVIVALCFFWRFLRRERWRRQWVAYWRMKQIEKDLER